jgi:DNA polymerase
MLIAQAPGENEDRKGRMFIGPSGKVLDELLEEAGIARKEVYMTNLVKCMLPKYRRPKQDEIKVCSEYLAQEVEIINPKVMVPLGYYACKHIFEKYSIPIPSRTEFTEICGKLIWHKYKKYFLSHILLRFCIRVFLKK